MASHESNKLEKLKNKNKESAFNRQGYRVSCETSHMYRNLRFYSEDYTDSICDRDLVASMMPEFQRDNDNWNIDRKIKFVENILAGYPTDIILFTVKNSIMSDCRVIDGQQRLTALDDWFKGKFPIHGDIYYSDIKRFKRSGFSSSRVSIVIHNFDSEVDAVNFYIDINEGITHSSDDIERAKDYLKMKESENG